MIGYIPDKFRDKLDELTTVCPDNAEAFENKEKFLSKYPNAKLVYTVYTNPALDYRGISVTNPLKIDYSKHPDFEIWISESFGSGKYFFHDVLNEPDTVTEMSMNVVNEIIKMMVKKGTFIVQLLRLADILDQKGLYKEADQVTDIALDYGRLTPENIKAGDRIKFIPVNEGLKFIGHDDLEHDLYGSEWLKQVVGNEGVVTTYPLHYGRPEEDKNWAAIKFDDGSETEVRVQDLLSR